MSMKKYTVEVPEYFSVRHYQEFDKFAHLDEQDQMLAMISLLTSQTVDEIREWPVELVVKVYNELQEMLKALEPQFYPVIEWKGKLYGYQPMHKMTGGEYIDLNNLCKNSKDNLTEILAIMYRPVVENKLDTSKFITKSVVKAYGGKVENAFNYYTLEKYDSSKRKVAAKDMLDFPATIALGALTFFLGSKAQLSKDFQTSFPTWEIVQTELKKQMKSKTKYRLVNTTVGYLRSMSYLKRPSFL